MIMKHVDCEHEYKYGMKYVSNFISPSLLISCSGTKKTQSNTKIIYVPKIDRKWRKQRQGIQGDGIVNTALIP
jgi:hypothetical protein